MQNALLDKAEYFLGCTYVFEGFLFVLDLAATWPDDSECKSGKCASFAMTR